MKNKMQQSIINALGIDLLSPQEQDAVMAQLGGLVFTAVMERTLDKLQEKDQKEFEGMMDNDETVEKLFDFLGNKIPNIQEIIKEEGEKIKKESEEMLSKFGM